MRGYTTASSLTGRSLHLLLSVVTLLSLWWGRCNSFDIVSSRHGTHLIATRNIHQYQWQLKAASDNDNDDDDDDKIAEELRTEQRHLRFAGVGRLYTDTTTLVNDGNIDNDGDNDDNGLEPHLQVVERLSKATVIVVGLGGVGSWAAEALCRSGIGNLVMIDLDDICISNTNRQLHATSTTVGKMKIDQMQQRLLDINPDCNITLIHDFVSHDNIDSILEQSMTIAPDATSTTACLDAIDGAISKSALIAGCARFGIPLVTVGGSAGRTDPTKIECMDLVRVGGDPLLKACRKNLRRMYGFEQGKPFRQEMQNPSRKWNIQAVVSEEPQKRVDQGDTSSMRRCDGALGTACFVTGSFGFVAAGKVIDMIASGNLVAPRGFTIPVPVEESV